uniref:Monocarboxylate transporter 12 n=1 Tax=Schistocephalus solidus TaxID=70667 RepID=A0A0X3PXN0_SCHSO
MILTPSTHRPRAQTKARLGDTMNMPEEEENEDCAAKSRALLRNIGDGLVQLFSPKVWANWGFLTFIVSNGLCAAGVVIPWTFIYDYVYQIWLAGVPRDSISSQVYAQLAWYPSLIGLGSCCGQVLIGIIASVINKEASRNKLSIRSGDVDVVEVQEASHSTCCRRFWNLSNLHLLFASICLFNGVATIAFTFLSIPSALDVSSQDLLILSTSQGCVLAFASFMVGLSDGGFMTLLGLMLENEVEEQYFPAALGICLCVTGVFNFVGTVIGGHIFDVFATYTPAMLLASCLSFTGFLLFVFLHCVWRRPSSHQEDVQNENVSVVSF